MRTPTNSKLDQTTSSNCKSLSLIVFESNPVTQDQPEPLKVFDPRLSPEKSLSRSPGFTSSSAEFKSQNVAKKLRLIDPSHYQRRSPRLFGNESNLSALYDSPEKKVTKKTSMEVQMSASRVLDNICLRRSPRFADNSASVQAENGQAKSALAKVRLRHTYHLNTWYFILVSVFNIFRNLCIFCMLSR